MTPMQIIVAATRNAAHVCGLASELGTLQPGKLADVLVVDGDALADLHALTQTRLVLRDGVVITAGGASPYPRREKTSTVSPVASWISNRSSVAR